MASAKRVKKLMPGVDCAKRDKIQSLEGNYGVVREMVDMFGAWSFIKYGRKR